ncbi:glutaredoxin [Choiromyces venosus 120613-1]|uniref:Glutaredoxin n=1 Tax=Choiromyces venosus 120613-1 TaxID=1336337 RepID=A0A3N4K681_9PEZI|nr:glutaredoxin [Choiromyces venosus 120613-1]
MSIQIRNEGEISAILGKTPADKLVILNFYAAWAEPCTQMNQVFEAIATASPNAATYLSIDAEDEANASATEEYDVSAVPYFLFLKNNTFLQKVSGADPALLKSAVEKHSGFGTLNLPAKQTTVSSGSASNGITTADGAGGEDLVEDINVRLGKLVSAAPVMLFMKGTPAQPQCGFSRQLVALLREREVRYGFFNILADDEVRQGLKIFSDWPTYPQLYYQGVLIGGLDIVKEEFENDPDFLRPGIAPPPPPPTAD